MKYSSIQFARNQNEFFVTLTKRVNEYFKSNKIERTANGYMIFKTAFMLALYFTPYGFILSGAFTATWQLMMLYVIMGFGAAGIGLSIMHDANHGSYSKKAWINNTLGLTLNILGGTAFNWKLQHNVLHHTYTNIHEADEDISPRGVLRMAPDSEWRPFHRFQYLYAWFFYGLLTIVWIVAKDINRLMRYERMGLVKKQKSNAAFEWMVLVVTKLVFIFYTFILPLMLVPEMVWWQTLVGFFIMHYIAGFILAIIFQPAHVIDGTAYPQPDENGNMENNWAIHQLHTTTNFGNKSRLFSWYVGGLNYQVEHHLFPNVCHVHYRAISPIVQETAREFGLPYKSKETFLEALRAHTVLMKKLGQRPQPVLVPA